MWLESAKRVDYDVKRHKNFFRSFFSVDQKECFRFPAGGTNLRYSNNTNEVSLCVFSGLQFQLNPGMSDLSEAAAARQVLTACESE